MKRADRAAAHFEQAARRAPLARRGVDGLGRSAFGDRWTRGCARDRSRGPETESEQRAARGTRRRHVPSAAQTRRSGRGLRRPLSRCCPRMPSIRQQLGELQRDLGQIDAALASLRDAVAVDPTNASGMERAGDDAWRQRTPGRSRRRRSARRLRATARIIATASISDSSSSARAAADEARPYFEQDAAARARLRAGARGAPEASRRSAAGSSS